MDTKPFTRKKHCKIIATYLPSNKEISPERRYSSRTFRYGYLVTT